MTPQVVFMGEAPGRMEAVHRAPFRGAAGHVLDGLLASIGLRRSDVFITNVVKYRPTIGASVRNRTPRLAEQMASWPYLERELGVFPGVPVVAMGNVSLYALHFNPTVRISGMHGQTWERKGRLITAWFHPAVAVYEPSTMDTLLDDARTFLDQVLAPF